MIDEGIFVDVYLLLIQGHSTVGKYKNSNGLLGHL